MEDIRTVSDERLNRPGPGSLTDERAAEALGLDMDELIRIMDVWMEFAGENAKERMRRRNERLANAQRTVVR
ncbi:hypothetical protein SEA_COMRADE_120 [Streptomyces phage Comrade]|uniref:Uncharacterized protein n=3 Tax=Gilsonvirus comrade TaxID=2846395 RepID=A0A345ME40_9CAUD|nr:hypothetical protein HWB84_gp139 [Streptomyces phage Comrade]AXH68821.1 hypothetical protein SEA_SPARKLEGODDESS_122 [Streptomyces phage SparkleGoddess]QQO39796.1 hypothetical protein SEA_BELFORT_124 [Streptomyces phage Belfort]QZE11704.1 hypothetical protein SEA_KARP_120 [Streptomyces phage Karp]UTN92364.1 hypothetical protein SEA_STIGMA_122 [Streptomyces phage Stigma]AXQ63376.1 hypothetical protein SEA_COMRADE_120 [Streptomyces phage Comrade]